MRRWVPCFFKIVSCRPRTVIHSVPRELRTTSRVRICTSGWLRLGPHSRGFNHQEAGWLTFSRDSVPDLEPLKLAAFLEHQKKKAMVTVLNSCRSCLALVAREKRKHILAESIADSGRVPQHVQTWRRVPHPSAKVQPPPSLGAPTRPTARHRHPQSPELSLSGLFNVFKCHSSDPPDRATASCGARALPAHGNDVANCTR